jgi:hypothetical protein
LADIALPWRPDPDTRTNLSKLGDVGLAIGSFLAGPAGAAGFLLGFAGQARSQDPGPHYTVHLDPDAGLVSIGGLEGSAQAKTANVGFARTGYALEKRKSEDLQQVFNTGKLQPGLPKVYLPVARALIELHNLFPQTPFVPPDGTGIPGIDARVPFGVEGGLQRSPPGPEFFMPRIFEVPPGGFAGFAQQTVAGQRQMAKPGIRRKAGIVRASVGQRRSSSYRASGGGSRQFAARRKVRLVKGRRGRKAAYLLRGRKKKAHLVKGSAAAKAFMKRLRNMQGKAGRRRRRRRR